MIIKISHSGEQKTQARKAIEYILRPKKDQGKYDRILALKSNCDLPYFEGIEPETFSNYMSEQMQETFLHKNKKPQKFLYDHIIFSYAKDDKLTPDQAIERGKEALLDYWNQSRKKKRRKPLTELPMDFVLAAQNDTENGILHVHGIIGRRDRTGFYNNFSESRRDFRSIAIGIEDRYGYTATEKVAAAKARPANHKEWQDMKKGQKNNKFHVRKCVENALNKSSNVREFVEAMKLQKVYPVPNISTSGKMSGFKFRHDGEYFTASQLHRSFGWGSIRKQLNFDPESDMESLKILAEEMARVTEKIEDNINSVYGSKSGQNGKKKFDNRYALHRIMRADENGIYRFSRFDRVAFRDHGERISFASTSDAAVKAALQLCIEKGWASVTPRGNPEFKGKIWLHAQIMGLKVSGYEPTGHDVQKLQESYEINSVKKSKSAPIDPTETKKPLQQTVGKLANGIPAHHATTGKLDTAPSERQNRLIESMRRTAAHASKKRPITLYEEYYRQLMEVVQRKISQTGINAEPTSIQADRHIAKNMMNDGYSPDCIYSELLKNGNVDGEVAEKIVRSTLNEEKKKRLEGDASIANLKLRQPKPKPKPKN